jgi:hypothetical protein
MPTETHIWRSPVLQMGEQPSQLLDTERNHHGGFDYATADRLLLFALPDVRPLCVSLNRARKQARKASASMRADRIIAPHRPSIPSTAFEHLLREPIGLTLFKICIQMRDGVSTYEEYQYASGNPGCSGGCNPCCCAGLTAGENALTVEPGADCNGLTVDPSGESCGIGLPGDGPGDPSGATCCSGLPG